MNVKLLTVLHLEFLSLKGGCRGSSEYTCQNVKLLEISYRGQQFAAITLIVRGFMVTDRSVNCSIGNCQLQILMGHKKFPLTPINH